MSGAPTTFLSSTARCLLTLTLTPGGHRRGEGWGLLLIGAMGVLPGQRLPAKAGLGQYSAANGSNCDDRFRSRRAAVFLVEKQAQEFR